MIEEGMIGHYVKLSKLRIPGWTFNKPFEMICECAHKESLASDSVTYIRIQSPIISVTPSSGVEAYQTEIELTVKNILSGYRDRLLSFRFGYEPDAETIPVQYLTGWTSQNSVSKVRLPSLGPNSGSSIKVFAQIRDDKGFLDQIETTVSVTRSYSTYTSLIPTLSEQMRKIIKYDLFKGATLLMTQLLIYPNLNALKVSRRKRRALPDDDLQADVIHFIELAMQSPRLPEPMNQAIVTIDYLVEKSGGRLHPDMVTKITDFYKYITSFGGDLLLELKGDIDYGEQVKKYRFLTFQ